MNDLEQRVARALCNALDGPCEIDKNCICGENQMVRARAALAALPLTPEQLEGLARGDMVVVPRALVSSKFAQNIASAMETKMAEIDHEWQPIETAPIDGTEVWVHVAAREGLPSFECNCAYHPDAGWCADEIRDVTHWNPHHD